MSYLHAIHLAALIGLLTATHAEAEISASAVMAASSSIAASSPPASTTTLKPFTTDGCSEFPNGTPGQQNLWLNCCIAHDKKYWAGGTHRERLQADRELKECVTAAGEPAIAELMLAGVRVGGSPWWHTPFRWGYGWPYGRGYKALTSDEKEQARILLLQYGK